MTDIPVPVVSVVAGIFGLLFGSFANVAIHRWPRGGTVTTPLGSHCPHCEASIAPHDNVPVVSWILLRGRCRNCRGPISGRYPLVEAVTGVLFFAVAWVHGLDWELPALLAFAWAVVVATAIDLEHRIIPNRLTYRLPLFLLPLLTLAAWQGEQWVDLRRGLIAGVAIPGVMLLLSETFRLLRGQAGIGMGDIKLAVSIGLVVGYLGGWELVIFAYGTMISGVVIAVGLMLAGKAKMASRIPYGPYLAIGSLAALLSGEPLTQVLEAWLGL